MGVDSLRQCRRMLRLLVGDEYDEIRVQATIDHPERFIVILSGAKNLKRSDVLRDSSSLCSSE